MKLEKVTFLSEGQNIAGILHLPEGKNPPCVIASHGLLSSKESDKYVALGERLSQEGIALLRFDFRGCGESEGRWEDGTIGGRLADLEGAIRFVKSHPGIGRRMGLMGSSLGGYITVIKASMERGNKAVVIWSTPFHLDDLESKQGAEGVPPLGKAFFEDLPNHRLLPHLPNLSNCLVIHGEKDELVPVDQAWEIFSALGSPKEIRVLEGADHRLTDPTHRQRAMDLTAHWFKRNL